MARPPKDKTGFTDAWISTSMRLPRWLADQIKARATAAGFDESWEILLYQPEFQVPSPLPDRYEYHDGRNDG